ncbi:MAG: hypothetical protein LBU70_01530 [Chitinispirillales bacterium]|jgi:hypothetical protein|nr:hypothetical protein [Chitinispirillales bacterium]
MASLVFESVIANDTIKIPREYTGKLSPHVIVTLEERRADKQGGHSSAQSKKMPHCINIGMAGFKFNRNEANER